LIDFEDIEIYLPKYLGEDSKKALFEGISLFPDNLNKTYYTNKLVNDPVVYQGDGIRNLSYLLLPKLDVRPVDAFIISNTCDIDPSNTRLFQPAVTYAPILKLEKYRENLLHRGEPEQAVKDHIGAIKRQEITTMFFLPAYGTLLQDSIALLNALISCDNNVLNRDNMHETRLFSLSDYGHYLFLVKISIHFCRIHPQGVERGAGN
jgi:hypothetical protein